MVQFPPPPRFTRRISALSLVFVASFVGLGVSEPASAAPPKAPVPVAKPPLKVQAEAKTSPKGAIDKASTEKPTTEKASLKKAEPGTEAKTDEKEPATAAETQQEAVAPPSAEQLEQAKLAFEAGNQAFEAGDFSTAASKFQEAHQTIPSPHAEYWFAQSVDKADPNHEKTKAVVAAYAKFLSNPGATHVGSTHVSAAETRLKELKALLPAIVQLTTLPAGATVVLDGNQIEGVTPLELELTSGAHKMEFSLEGHDAIMIEINAVGGDATEQQVNLTPTAEVAAPVAAVAPPAPAETRSMIPAYVTLGLGGAGLISGTVFGIMALNSKSKFNDTPTTDHADAAERNALIADMSFGIALTLGITGIVLLTADDGEEDEQAKKSTKPNLVVAPYGTRHGGGAAARLTF